MVWFRVRQESGCAGIVFPRMSFSDSECKRVKSNRQHRIVETLLATSLLATGRDAVGRDVASYVSTARFGRSLRMVLRGRSWPAAARDGASGVGGRLEQRLRHFRDADVSRQARHVQPVRNREINKRHQRSSQQQPAATAPFRRSPTASKTTVVATTKATRCARPVQVLTAKTAPARSRQKSRRRKSRPWRLAIAHGRTSPPATATSSAPTTDEADQPRSGRETEERQARVGDRHRARQSRPESPHPRKRDRAAKPPRRAES